MKASDNPFPSILIDEEVDPAAPAAGHKRLFVDSADHKLKTIDSASAVVDYTPTAAVTEITDIPTAEMDDSLVLAPDGAGGVEFRAESGGIADEGAFTYLDATDAAAPANPSAGYARIYSKSGRIYSRDSAGVEYGPFDEAGTGGGPLLYIDSLALHADGDDFDDDTLAGWTVVNVTASEVTTEVYDATCLDLQFGTHKDRIWKAISASDNIEISLTCYGITNSTPSPATAVDGMIGLFFSDDAGTGTAMSLYESGATGYMWALSTYGYSATGNQVAAVFPVANWAIAASACPLQMKLKKVGNTITGSWSRDGVKWASTTRSDSTTMTRMGIIRAWSGGGTNPKLRVGRFNVEEL